MPCSEVWTRPLKGGDVAVAIFNHDAKSADAAIAWASLGLVGPYAVRDLWGHADRGSAAEKMSVTVPAHGVTMLRVSKK